MTSVGNKYWVWVCKETDGVGSGWVVLTLVSLRKI